MQLSGIIAFLILSQYDVAITSQHDEHFAQDLELLQNSLVQRIYDGSSPDPVEEDDDRIEEIADAIIREAERRLKRRELSKKDHSNKKSDENINSSQHDEAYIVGAEEHKVYKDTVSVPHKDVTQIRSSSEKEDDEKKDKRILYDDKEKQDKKYVDQMKLQRKRHNFNGNIEKDEVEISHGDNNQVATIKLDNAPDQQIKLSHNYRAAKELFLEPEVTDRQRNKSTYALHHRSKSPPQQKVVSTNKVDRSGLDEFSFIAIIVACCVAGVAGIGLVSYCWYRLRTETKGSNNGSPSFKSNSQGGSDGKKTTDEEKLVRGAEVFHYLHAKKQMQQMEEPNLKSVHCSINESSDEEEDEDTVYECPGLAPPGDMKVVNPLFSDTESHYSDPPSLHSTPTPPSEEK